MSTKKNDSRVDGRAKLEIGRGAEERKDGRATFNIYGDMSGGDAGRDPREISAEVIALTKEKMREQATTLARLARSLGVKPLTIKSRVITVAYETGEEYDVVEILAALAALASKVAGFVGVGGRDAG